MSVETRVEEWLREMGYDEAIPSSLPKICNASTAFVWEQLISNVKPRQEVEHKRKNIIVNRLSKKSLDQQDQFSYPIRELQVYMEKQKLEKRIQYLEKTIEEKENIVDDLLKKNDVTYVALDNVKAKVKESKEKKFLIDKKSKMFEEEIQRSRDVLTLARNLTPVEMDVSANPDEITKTLHNCAEKLQKLSNGISLPKTTNTNKSTECSVMRTAKISKYSSKNNTISRYVNQSSVLADIAPSTCKKLCDSNKEHINYSQVLKVGRCLKFSDSDTEMKTNKNVKKERESLGLLPDVVLDESDDFDKCFLNSSKSENDILQPLTDSMLETPKNTDFHILEIIRSEKSVKELLKDLLHKNNRFLILSQWRNIYEELLREMRGPIMECNKLLSSDRDIDQNDIMQLFFIHVKTELEKDKCRLHLKKLHENVKKRKEEIFLSNKMRNKDDAKRIFELQIEDAYLSGANSFLRREINSSEKYESDNEAAVLNIKIKHTKEEVVYKSNCVQHLISNIYKVLDDIRTNREETLSCVRNLHPFIRDLNWANMMTEAANSQEVDVFKNFPLEYNRAFKYNNTKVYHRNISNSSIPSYIKPDSNELDMFATILNQPFASAENVIFEALRTKIVANKLLSIQPSELSNVHYHKYTQQELSEREEYVEVVLSKLNSIINSVSVRETLASPVKINEMTELWLEMPFRNFISEKRQVEGHGFKFYENIFKEARNNSK